MEITTTTFATLLLLIVLFLLIVYKLFDEVYKHDHPNKK